MILHKTKLCTTNLVILCRNVRKVNNWSPLASAFNTKRSWGETTDYLTSFLKEGSGLFTYPELKEHTGLYILKEQMTDKSYELMEEIVSQHRKRKMVEIFDELSDNICRVADLAEFLRHVPCDLLFSESAENVNYAVSSLVEKLNTNQQLYYSLKSVVEDGDIVPTDEYDNYVAKLFLFDFEQSGVHLDKEKRERFVNLSEKIHNVSTWFLQGTQVPNAVSLDQTPAILHNCYEIKDERLYVDSLHSSSPDELVREASYKIYLYPNTEQEKLLSELLSYRHELAELAGFPTYSHRATRGTIIESPDKINEFIEALANKVAPRAEKDFGILQKMKEKELGEGMKLRPWDVGYYSEKVKKEILDMNTTDIMAYLPLGACMDGLSNVISSLFGVSLHAENVMLNEVWDLDVFKIRVEDGDGSVLGYIYCDFFDRCVKPRQQSHFTIVGGKSYPDESFQLPVVVLLLSLSEPTKFCPCLLTPYQVETLFHEFGHALHSMFARTKYQHVTGTRCATDFAEVPSVMMEYFASHPKVIKSFARHYNTSEPIPDELVDKICQSKSLFPASDMQFQLYYSSVDQTLHGPHPLPASMSDINSECMSRHYKLGHIPNTACHLRFSHLVSYGAKYYSYLLCRAVVSKMWQQSFQGERPWESPAGGKLREILSHGGGKPPMELVEYFLGSQPSINDLVTSLVDEVDRDQERQDELLSGKL